MLFTFLSRLRVVDTSDSGSDDAASCHRCKQLKQLMTLLAAIVDVEYVERLRPTQLGMTIMAHMLVKCMGAVSRCATEDSARDTGADADTSGESDTRCTTFSGEEPQ